MSSLATRRYKKFGLKYFSELQTLFSYIVFFFKEEPHTNIKDLPKQLAKLNVCIDNSLAICYYEGRFRRFPIER